LLLGCNALQLQESLQFWSRHRILEMAGEYLISLEGISAERLQELTGTRKSKEIKGSDTISHDQIEAIWPMLEGMLTNLGPSKSEVIHRTLSMFIPDLSLNLKEFTSLLHILVDQQKLEKSQDTFFLMTNNSRPTPP
jgi:hypothetical protein